MTKFDERSETMTKFDERSETMTKFELSKARDNDEVGSGSEHD